jgi:hypothetical protein
VLARILGRRSPTLGARAVDMGPLLDTVIVCAVGTILLIRTELWLTNYPQLGGHGLHIAHLLWGGLGMLIAIVLLVSFLSPGVRRTATVLGGIGLGFFIDELGKFLTADNNYFFKPTAAIIYIFFIVFYLGARALQRRRPTTPQEYLANALELAKDAAVGDMDEDERRRALRFVDHADQSDPAVTPLRTLLESVRVRPKTEPWLGRRLLSRARAAYVRLTRNRWFIRGMTAFFVLWALATLLEVVGLVFALEPHLREQREVTIGGPITSKGGHYGFVEWASIAAELVAGAFVVWGLVLIRRSRVAAYAMFERALLVALFFGQVFLFIQSQFGACVGFVIDVLLLITIRFMLARERELAEDGSTEVPGTLASPLPA